jgi:hypothetical protein
MPALPDPERVDLLLLYVNQIELRRTSRSSWRVHRLAHTVWYERNLEFHAGTCSDSLVV